MTTQDKPQIRNVLAAPAGQPGGQWVCQPIALGTDDRICGVCRMQRLEPFATECPSCRATILWDAG
jgi:hypothetical protein